MAGEGRVARLTLLTVTAARGATAAASLVKAGASNIQIAQSGDGVRVEDFWFYRKIAICLPEEPPMAQLLRGSVV
jgi:hypothetical protein